jgi:hypothetical protein
MARAEERRVAPRSSRGFSVQSSEGDSLIKYIDNISSSGVLCHTSQPIPEMTKFGVVLELPEPVNRQVTAEGLVIRCDVEEPAHDQFRVAIIFTKIEEDDIKTIHAYVEYDLLEGE